MHVLGIDAGGTKTVAFLADADGRIIAEGRAGGANLQTEGELQVEKVLHDVIEQVDARPQHHARGGVPRHGRRGSRGRRPHHSRHHAAARLSLEHVIVNDALIALVAGAGASPGLVVISGTGSIAFGVSHRGAGGARRRMGIHPWRRGVRVLDRPARAGSRDARRRWPRPANRADPAGARTFLSCRDRSRWCGDLPSAAGPPRDRRARRRSSTAPVPTAIWWPPRS